MKGGMGFPDGSGCCQLQAEGCILGFFLFFVLVALGMWAHRWSVAVPVKARRQV